MLGLRLAALLPCIPLSLASYAATLQELGNVGQCALTTPGNAGIAAHDIYTCVAIGGNLKDLSPNEHGRIGSRDKGTAFVGGAIDGRWNFDGDPETAPYTAANIDFARVQKLVEDPSLKTFTDGTHSVYVNPTLQRLPTGQIFLDDGQLPGREEAQPEDNGNTIVILTTSTPVVIGKTALGRQFGPTILAPFADVTLLGEAGYIDGCVIAKSFTTSDGFGEFAIPGSQSQLQMHGMCYKGPLWIPSTTVSSTSPATTTMITATPAITTTVAHTTTTTSKKYKHKCKKWWLWLIGAGGAVIAAGLSVPLIVNGVQKSQAQQKAYAHPAPAAPCVTVAPYGVKFAAHPSMDDSDAEDYRMGQEFGRAWAYTILCSFAVLLVLLFVAVFRRRRRARSTRITESFHHPMDDELPAFE
mmetsp:Transcript_110055/g.173932  ORF Transcript_110055/g.173932 Transcript_110055/m.173932 type:complete len:413 (+) Transcript_110055:41-1279(+)